MKTTLFLLIPITFLNTSCNKGPTDEILFNDTKDHIQTISNGIIDLIEIEVVDKKHETVMSDEIVDVTFIGIITFNKDCYLDWNNSAKPIFFPEFSKPTHSDSHLFKFHKKGDKIEYTGRTTYMMKNGQWELFSQ